MSETIQTAADAGTLSGPQKLAALLVILGTESASQVLQRLEEPEIEAVSTEVTRLGLITPQVQQQILQEFGQAVAEAAAALRGGPEVAEALLEQSLGATKASFILNRVAPARRTSPAIQRLATLEPGQIANVLKQERAQTAALVISCLPAARAALVLRLCSQDFRQQIVERVATLGAAPAETIDRLAEMLLDKAGPQQRPVLTQPGGLKTAAGLLNGLDKRLSQPLLSSLEERNPELGQAIRQKMFTFEDLARLDSSSLQRILREVDLRDLALALKPVSESIRTTLLSCISRRAGETVKEEMGFLGPVKLKEIEGAQVRIVNILRRLETEGEIDLGGDSQEEETTTAAV
jgi:flagellar motor switch protein FliG